MASWLDQAIAMTGGKTGKSKKDLAAPSKSTQHKGGKAANFYRSPRATTARRPAGGGGVTNFFNDTAAAEAAAKAQAEAERKAAAEAQAAREREFLHRQAQAKAIEDARAGGDNPGAIRLPLGADLGGLGFPFNQEQTNLPKPSEQQQKEQEQADYAALNDAIRRGRKGFFEGEKSFKPLSWEDYKKLSTRSRAAVDFNSALQDAFTKDRAAGKKRGGEDGTWQLGEGVSDKNKKSYRTMYERVFGEDMGDENKAIYAPNTVALLNRMGVRGNAGSIDEYLRGDAFIGRKELNDKLRGEGFRDSQRKTVAERTKTTQWFDAFGTPHNTTVTEPAPPSQEEMAQKRQVWINGLAERMEKLNASLEKDKALLDGLSVRASITSSDQKGISAWVDATTQAALDNPESKADNALLAAQKDRELATQFNALRARIEGSTAHTDKQKQQAMSDPKMLRDFFKLEGISGNSDKLVARWQEMRKNRDESRKNNESNAVADALAGKEG